MYLLENDTYISLIEENEEDPVSVMDLCIKENDNKILEKIEIHHCAGFNRFNWNSNSRNSK